MIKKKILLKNYIQKRYLKKKNSVNISNKFERIFNSIKKDIKNPNKTLNVLNKTKLYFKIKEIKKFNKFKSVAIVGMGGSILGTKAIYYFLKDNIKKKFYFFDNLDENKIIDFKKKEKFTKVLFIIISKSGNTIETLFNTLILKILKKDANNIIIISERKNNVLFSLSKKFNLFYVEHKKYIGGRYSVLSEVGILPAYLMGIDIIRLRSQALDFLNAKNRKYLKDSSIKLANLMKSKKYNNLIFLNYVPELEKFLNWCQQLIAESLGKKGKGFLPVISNVPKDHHSLLQLYLDGPKDKIFYIFSSEDKSNKSINLKKNNYKINFLNNKSLYNVKNAQKDALIKALAKKNIPFREFKIKAINEQELGKLFSYFIIETVIIGKLLNIDPFDQPAVEEIKFFTKKKLS